MRNWLAIVASIAAAAAAAAPPVRAAVARRLAVQATEYRIDAVAVAFARDDNARGPVACAVPPITAEAALARRIDRLTPLLASWQSVGGCGAGAPTSTGTGVKWIGRNVTGGLFHIESQANYIAVPYGYHSIATALVSRDITAKWNLGVSVPFVYKYMNDPYQVGIDVSNHGIGDIRGLLTRRFGTINDWKTTLSVGAPTGSTDAMFRGDYLPQDRQLGNGRFTASLMLDHVSDTDWGLILLGGIANWRGGNNARNSYRSPSASLYGYVGRFLGRFTPAAGLSVTGFSGRDRDRGTDLNTPLVSVAANASVEWAADRIAILLGASLPYEYLGHERNTGDIGAWILSLGVAAAPF